MNEEKGDRDGLSIERGGGKGQLWHASDREKKGDYLLLPEKKESTTC